MIHRNDPRAEALLDLRTLLEKEASDIDELQRARTAELEERSRLADAVLQREPTNAPAHVAAEQAARVGQHMLEQVTRLAELRRQAVADAVRDLTDLLGDRQGGLHPHG
ncbi:hypothetical protein AB0O75_05520 [Streptomyces sp. NPDC088921]|uniref:hypothetical protein n=1 Tax=Streptomyces sp. NPDC088921 TaxID=3155062 RepID=UPI00343B0A28